MSDIKMYLKCDETEINSYDDLISVLRQDKNCKIEVLEPVLGKFLKWSMIGKVISFQSFGEPFNGLHVGSCKIKVDEYIEDIDDLVHTDIHRDTTIGFDILNKKYSVENGGEIQLSVYWVGDD